MSALAKRRAMIQAKVVLPVPDGPTIQNESPSNPGRSRRVIEGLAGPRPAAPLAGIAGPCGAKNGIWPIRGRGRMAAQSSGAQSGWAARPEHVKSDVAKRGSGE